MQHWRAPNLSFLSGNGHCIRTQLPSIRRLESTQLRFIKRISTRQSLAFNTSTIAKCPTVDFKDDYVYHALALSPLDVSVSDVVTKQESFFLVELSQSFIEALHSTAGLPWWAALSISGVLLRAALFPLFLVQVKSIQRMKDAGGDIRKLSSAIRYTRALSPAMDNIKQIELLKLAAKGYQIIFKKHNFFLLQTGLSSFIHIPAFVVMAYSAREMVRSGTFPGLETGGFGPWTNLMIPDDTFILPILASTLTYAGMELSLRNRSHLWTWLGRKFQLLPLLGLPFLVTLPQGIFFFWIASSSASLAQSYLMRTKRMQRFLRIQSGSSLHRNTLSANPSNKITFLPHSHDINETLWTLHSSSCGDAFKSTFGVAIDVDGVLIRGKVPIPGAASVLQGLQDRAIPHVIMTNAGGYVEERKAEQLSEILNYEIDPKKMCLSHSPMRKLAAKYKNELVLAVGKDCTDLSAVMKKYGFQNALTVGQLHNNFPKLYPDIPISSDAERLNMVQLELCKHQFAAVFVLIDPIYWGRELQIVMDVVCAQEGRLGDKGLRQQVPVYSACMDFQYMSDFHLPRYGAGAFRAVLEHLYHRTTGHHLEQTFYGKPEKTSFEYVEKLIDEQHENVERIYMIGDNPLTDIQGANGAGGRWKSLLTLSGMHVGPGNHKEHPAYRVVADVNDAFKFMLQDFSKAQ
ncbi:hypothetical protein ABG067_006465 [Albugo candida]